MPTERQPDGRQPDERQPLGRQPSTIVPSPVGFFYTEGTLVDSLGVVQIELVSWNFAGAVGDSYILGTRHRSDGAMYMTNDDHLFHAFPNVHINGILHSYKGIRYNAGIGASEDKVSKGFITSEVNGAGRQITTTVVAGNIEHGILRSEQGEMVVEENP